MKKEILITDFLAVGRENAKTRRDLKQVVGIPDREIRRYIEIERLNGTPIINTGSGYYIANPEDIEDIREVEYYIKQMRARETAIHAGIYALSHWLEGVALSGR